jgi:hypothetical protein
MTLRLAALVIVFIWSLALPRDAAPVRGESEADRNVRGSARLLVDRLDHALMARCLTPAAEQAMSGVVASGALHSVLGSDLSLVNGVVRASQIEVEIADRAQRSYRITLALPGVQEGKPDGEGRQFLFYLAATNPPHPRASRALLEIAASFDKAIPETALIRCSGTTEPQGDPRYPLGLALGSALAELAIIVTAMVYGLRAVRPGGRQ